MRAEIYWITDVPLFKLAIMPRPRGGDWLADELQSIKSAGVDIIVSLLTNEEVVELNLDDEPTLCEDLGLKYLSYPIIDRGVPSSIDDFLAIVNRLHDQLNKECTVAIHCRMGIGRSSLLAASLLVKAGLESNDAFRKISHSRGIDVPDTTEQAIWVETMADRLQGE